MLLTFDHAIDTGAWPGPLATTDATHGEAWLGPAGLLALLETRLGLAARHARPLQRACRLAAQLDTRTGHWRPAFDVDRIGTARRLLRDRDRLRMWGWTGQPVSPRLADLHAATEGASPGEPDRLWAVARGLAERKVDVARVTSYTRLTLLPPAWRAVFAALARQGVAIDQIQPQPAPAVGDLALARAPGFRPQRDGRLCLLRRYGVLDTADEVAASLAACDSLDGIVVIGADEVLDQALARHGLPRSDAGESAPASARLLTLVLEAAFEPMELTDLHALLVADPGPIPRRVARKLLGALREHPGRRSDLWAQALSEGLAAIEDDRRLDVDRRARGLLLPACGHEAPLPLSELRARLGLLAGWARARQTFQPSLAELALRAEAMVEDAEAMGNPGLTRHELRRLHDGLGPPSYRWRRAQAGLAHVRHPGALLASARAVVWWNFTRSAAPRADRFWLTAAERDGLCSAGLEPPAAAPAIEREAAAWRRPLLLAREALILACPLTDEAGETCHPHPLWDELTARLAESRDAAFLERDRLEHLAPAALVAVPPRPLPRPTPALTLPSPLALRETESPSSLEQLIGCSLAWTLKYRSRLKDSVAAPLPRPGPLTWGKVAHHILAQVLPREPTAPERAAALAVTLFDQQAQGLCEELGLPQRQAERASLRRVIEDAARHLAGLAARHGVAGLRTEHPARVSVAGLEIAGHIDLLWETPRVVIDLKWGKSSYTERLETGTAVQLATYAAMQGGGEVGAEVAYYSLDTRELLVEPRGRLRADGHAPGDANVATMWAATKATLEARRAALAAGLLEAPGAGEQEVKPRIVGNTLQIAPPCRYCSFGALCGRGGGQ